MSADKVPPAISREEFAAQQRGRRIDEAARVTEELKIAIVRKGMFLAEELQAAAQIYVGILAADG